VDMEDVEEEEVQVEEEDRDLSVGEEDVDMEDAEEVGVTQEEEDQEEGHVEEVAVEEDQEEDHLASVDQMLNAPALLHTVLSMATVGQSLAMLMEDQAPLLIQVQGNVELIMTVLTGLHTAQSLGSARRIHSMAQGDLGVEGVGEVVERNNHRFLKTKG